MATTFTNQTPGGTTYNPGTATELGVKFYSNVNGYIVGIRYYKAADATHQIYGNLWSITGTRLNSTSALLPINSQAGWVEGKFPFPIAITANTHYVASVNHDSDEYYDFNAFSSAGISNPPLFILQNGVDGGNGVSVLGPNPSFPTNPNTSENLWVDVNFQTSISNFRRRRR
jgi:hypothetical protein